MRVPLLKAIKLLRSALLTKRRLVGLHRHKTHLRDFLPDAAARTLLHCGPPHLRRCDAMCRWQASFSMAIVHVLQQQQLFMASSCPHCLRALGTLFDKRATSCRAAREWGRRL